MTEPRSYRESLPSLTSTNKLISIIKTRIFVEKIVEHEFNYITIHRRGKSSIDAYPTDTYIVSESDIYDITSDYKGLNAIVTMSMWTYYTLPAKDLAKTINIGLFSFKEFLGAIHYQGKKFLDYLPPDER